MTKDKKQMILVYEEDGQKIRNLKNEKKLKTNADAVRVCVEYAQAHGVFA